MKSFQIILRDTLRFEHIQEVISFVGEDSSGSFGILADHDRLITNLVFGLARFRRERGHWEYLAMPGAMLYFNNNELQISTRRYLRSDNYETISQALMEILTKEERDLLGFKRSLRFLEDNILLRLLKAENRGENP